MDNSILQRFRLLEATVCLELMGAYVKEDRDYEPTTAKTTRRVHVSAAGNDWELLVDGPKFYDTRTRTGGGGAIDLAMYLWGVPFKKAVGMLKAAGV